MLTALALNGLGLGGEPEPAAPAATGSPSASPPSAPFTVSARQDGDDGGCTALKDRISSPQDRAEIVTGGDVAAVVRRHRGARAGELTTELTIEGGRQPLTITSIDIEPEQPRPAPPFAGTLLCEEGAGGEPKIQLYADLDSPRPVFLTGKGSVDRYFDEHVVTLAPGEQVNLSAIFVAAKGSREFRLSVRYVRNGKEGAVPVPVPRGSRYAVTGYAAEYKAVYSGSPNGGFRLEDDSRPCRWSPAAPC
ncbi:hypothetical protein ACFW9O_11935 [Streptomyces sp. NPDC059499]|uniref:hypothetical protein n=1 Tax=Streptomyces sp. NPDC059499 TaxID=3346852 RepID=UPI00368EFEF5